MTHVPFRDGRWLLTAADLFVLDKWGARSPLSEAEQYDGIITRWIEGGPDPREPYIEQCSEYARDMQSREAFSQDAEADLQLLSRLRLSEQGWLFNAPVLRICYDDGTDEIFRRCTFEDDDAEGTGIGLSESEEDEVSNDASLFNFQDLPLGRGWRQMLYTFPHLLKSTSGYMRGKQLESWREAMAAVRTLEAGEPPLDEGAVDVEGEFLGFHASMVSGTMLVCDRTTLKETGSWLCVFYDSWGRLVRPLRVYGPEDDLGLSVQALLCDWTWDDMSFFIDAEVGPDYQDLARFGRDLGAEGQAAEEEAQRQG